MFADLLLGLDAENAREIFDVLRENRRNGRENWQQMALFLEAWGKLDGATAMAAIVASRTVGARAPHMPHQTSPPSSAESPGGVSCKGTHLFSRLRGSSKEDGKGKNER